MRIEVVNQSREFSKKEMYNVAFGQDNFSISEVPENKDIVVLDWIFYNKISQQADGTEKVTRLLSIITPDDTIYTTVSASFMNNFETLIQFIEKYPFPIYVEHRRSANGRTYLVCGMA